MYWDRFDIIEAWYLYSRHYHGGQFTDLYAVTGRIHNLGFSPGLSLRTYDEPEKALNENGQAIYYSLVERKALQ